MIPIGSTVDWFLHLAVVGPERSPADFGHLHSNPHTVFVLSSKNRPPRISN
jgi:hypothetical protein